MGLGGIVEGSVTETWLPMVAVRWTRFGSKEVVDVEQDGIDARTDGGVGVSSVETLERVRIFPLGTLSAGLGISTQTGEVAGGFTPDADDVGGLRTTVTVSGPLALVFWCTAGEASEKMLPGARRKPTGPVVTAESEVAACVTKRGLGPMELVVASARVVDRPVVVVAVMEEDDGDLIRDTRDSRRDAVSAVLGNTWI